MQQGRIEPSNFEAQIRSIVNTKCSPKLSNEDRLWLKNLLNFRKTCFATSGTIGLLPKGFEYRHCANITPAKMLTDLTIIKG